MSKKFILKGLTGMAAVAALALGGAAWAQNNNAPAGGYPPDAQPGQCFARVLIPEVTEAATEEVVVAAARQEVNVIPAKYEFVEERVVVKEARTEYVTVPATYRTVTETVVIEPERTEQVVQPAAMETYQERVLVRPAYVTWKPGNGLFGRSAGVVAASSSGGPSTMVDQATGELLCRVEVPAEYQMVTRTRIATPESAVTRTIPARTQQVTRQVIATAARVEERQIPAEYGTVRVQKMVQPATQQARTIPAVTRTETRRRIVSPARVEWREVLCETNASTARIVDIQNALTQKGYPNPADGRFGPTTQAAMERYQRTNGLAVGYLTMETVRSLGVAAR